MKADFFKIKKGYIKYLLIKILAISLLVGLDVLSKMYFLNNFSEGQTKTVLAGVFSFKYVKNTGAGFGIFQGGALVLAIISVIILVCLFLYDFFKGEKHLLYTLSFSFVAGGAIGNLIDRISLGFVVDFIKLEFMNFAIFNLADAFLTVGIILYAIYIFFFHESEEHKVKFINRN